MPAPAQWLRAQGVAVTMFHFHIVLGGGGSFRRMITTTLMLGAVGVGVYQLQSQGLAPSNRQLAAALVGAVPRLLQLEIVVLVLMIFFGGQSVLTYAALIAPGLAFAQFQKAKPTAERRSSFGQGILPRDPADADQGRDAG